MGSVPNLVHNAIDGRTYIGVQVYFLQPASWKVIYFPKFGSAKGENVPASDKSTGKVKDLVEKSTARPLHPNA